MAEVLYIEAINTLQILIKGKKRKYRKTKTALEDYKKIGFTRQKGFNNMDMPQYEKQVDIFSQSNHKHF